MKTLITILTLALISTASARIGETPEQSKKRYGKPVGVDKESQSIGFKKAGFSILLKYWKGKVHQVYIEPTTKDELGMNKKISKAQIEAILSANLGKDFGKLPKNEVFADTYASKNEKLFAKHDTVKNWLLISTVEYQKHLMAEKAKKEKEALKDF